MALSGTPVHVLEADPDLAVGLDGDDLSEATRLTVAEVEVVETGAWRPRIEEDGGLVYGGLILDGMVVRELGLASSASAELLGAGDVLAPYEPAHPVTFVPSEMGWTVLEPTRVAWLDHRFATAIRRWPLLGVTLLRRVQRRADRLAVTQAIAQITRVDDRVLALLWHLSERWGHMTGAGVMLPVKLTHKALAHLVGAQRPSVTTAIAQLEANGLVARRDDGAWVLGTPERPAMAEAPEHPVPWNVGASASLVSAAPVVPKELRARELARIFASQEPQVDATFMHSGEPRQPGAGLRSRSHRMRGGPD